MRYVDEYRDQKTAQKISRRICGLALHCGGAKRFMEVCGTHTNTFFRFGLNTLVPESVKVISGPGCPVCVTQAGYVDNSIYLAGLTDVIICTFGDMLKVPGSKSSLYRERGKARDIRVVYSPLDAVGIAQEAPDKNVVFLGVGFETTAPTVAMALVEAKRKKIKNFCVYSGHKTMPAALESLLENRDAGIDGFILPAHVSAIIGSRAYSFLEKYNIPAVIAGFEPLDMLQGILMLLEQIRSGRPRIEVEYDRVVKREGNKKAQSVLRHVFDECDAEWRGIGAIPKSGLKINKRYADFDAVKRFKIDEKIGGAVNTSCLCGDILKGKNIPTDCILFAKACTPERPKGPCMVSSEGSCSVHYKYQISKIKN